MEAADKKLFNSSYLQFCWEYNWLSGVFPHREIFDRHQTEKQTIKTTVYLVKSSPLKIGERQRERERQGAGLSRAGPYGLLPLAPTNQSLEDRQNSAVFIHDACVYNLLQNLFAQKWDFCNHDDSMTHMKLSRDNQVKKKAHLLARKYLQTVADQFQWQ